MAQEKRSVILVVEGDAGAGSLAGRRLEQVGYTVLLATTGEQALAHLRQQPVVLILLDAQLPPGDGLAFYTEAKAAGFDLPVILVMGAGNETTLTRALRIGVRDVLGKSPEFLDNLPDAVERVLRLVQTEHRLAESEARLRAIIRSAQDAVVIAEADGRISLFNEAAERMFRCSADQALGQPLTRFLPPQPGSPRAAASWSRCIGVRASGETFPLEASASTVEVAGKPLSTVVVRDVTERERAAAALQRSEAVFRQVWDRSLDGMRLADEEGTILWVNQTFCNLVGKSREALERQSLSIIYAETEREEVLAQHRGRFSSGAVESSAVREAALWDGRTVHLEISSSFLELPGEPPVLLSIIRDITERVTLERQLLQSQKMEAMGRLAGGVAHDFNNLLTVILGYAGKLLGETVAGDPLRTGLVEIHLAGERAAALTRQLLLFSRKQVAQPRVLALNALVRNLGNMLRRLIGEDIQLVETLAAGLWPIRIDPGQVEQVLLNLCVNARDAMPRGGRLVIETANVEVDEAYVATHPEAGSGKYVLLAVRDTGHGISKEVQEHIFEPFFTTKPEGKGSGLGLATVHGIVKQAGGHIGVASEPGQGCNLLVYLPPARDTFEAEHSQPAPPSPARGSETVLIVEDEPSVRLLVRLVLQQQGYTIVEAADAAEALRLAEKHTGPIHLVLTDLVMPGMSGVDLVQRLVAQRPEMKTLYMSGYTGSVILNRGMLTADMVFLQKPFTPDSLLQKVREVLEGEARPREDGES